MNLVSESLNAARARVPVSTELSESLASLAALERDTAEEEQADAAIAARAPNPWSLSGAARNAASVEAHELAARARARAAALSAACQRVEVAKEAEAQILALAAIGIREELEAKGAREAKEAADKAAKEAAKAAKERRATFDANAAKLSGLDAELDPLIGDMADLVLEMERKRLEILAVQGRFAGLAHSLPYEARTLGLPEPRARVTSWDAQRAVHQKIAALLAAAPIVGWDGQFHAADFAGSEG